MHVCIFNLNPNPNHICCLSGVLVWCFLSGVCLVFLSFLFVRCFVYGKRPTNLSRLTFTNLCSVYQYQFTDTSRYQSTGKGQYNTSSERTVEGKGVGAAPTPCALEHTGNGVGEEHTSAPPQRRQGGVGAVQCMPAMPLNGTSMLYFTQTHDTAHTHTQIYMYLNIYSRRPGTVRTASSCCGPDQHPVEPSRPSSTTQQMHKHLKGLQIPAR